MRQTSQTGSGSTGEKAIPFTTYVVKVVSRCNLNCNYCYMYNLADKTYRNQPTIMTQATTKELANRIRNHTAIHSIPWVHIILHGGEPLLMGRTRLQEWINTLRSELAEQTVPYFSIQTNGILIDDDWIDLLANLQVRIGVSVDGPKNYHDAARVDHQGDGSFDAVLAGIRRLQVHPRGKDIFSTVMAVVNPDIPPAELFEFWEFLGVSGFDLSLPHGNFAHPPYKSDASTYGDWLIAFFDLWFDQNRPDRHVRYFENIIRMLFRFPHSTDNIGGKPVGVIVVETDGSIEPTDAFKCCEEGITKIGLNVLSHNFDDLYNIPMVQTLQHGAVKLCEQCQGCELRDVCGGGYMPHRYSIDRGFDNPSAYCEDLKKLIYHIKGRVIESMPSDILEILEVGS